MIGAPTPSSRFQHLSPITFEYFHLAMKFLSVCFKCLFNKDSTETGTMKAEATRIQRKKIKEKVKDAYSVDKEFFISFTDAYIVEAVCQYFGLEDHLSVPHVYSAPYNAEERITWAKLHFKKLA